MVPVLVSAQQFGTKKDALSSATGSAGSAMPLLQMLIALGIVFALLKFALPKVAGKLNKRLITGVNSSIRIEESANFAGGSLYIVNARERTLLLSVGSNGVSCVADLTVAEKGPEPPLFSEMLDQATPYTPEEIVVEPSRPEPDPNDVRRALDRLARLAN
jgi:hypothetical protein